MRASSAKSGRSENLAAGSAALRGERRIAAATVTVPSGTAR
ncbi:hypothetical protein ABQE48_01610 [Mycolicibacterium thermoresistibile]